MTTFISSAEYHKLLKSNFFGIGPDSKELDLTKFTVAAGCGLRYYLKDYCAKFDMGFSRESIGIYFNFNHVF